MKGKQWRAIGRLVVRRAEPNSGKKAATKLGPRLGWPDADCILWLMISGPPSWMKQANVAVQIWDDVPPPNCILPEQSQQASLFVHLF